MIQKQFSSRNFKIDFFWKIFSRPLPVGMRVRACVYVHALKTRG